MAFLKNNTLLNSQDGKEIAVTVKDIGLTTISVRDQPTSARHYQLISDDFTIDLWYSAADNTWLQLQSTTQRKGKNLYYKLI